MKRKKPPLSSSPAHPPRGAAESSESLRLLSERQLRVTLPRKRVLEVLLESHGPFSVDEVLALARSAPGTKRMDRVTVYRCLIAFERLGLARRCELGDGLARYEFSAADHHHHHVVCKRCRRMEVLESCIPQSLLEEVEQRGFSEVTHSLEFFGLCAECSGRGRTG